MILPLTSSILIFCAIFSFLGFGKEYKIDANTRNIALNIRIVTKTEGEAGFSDSGVSNQNKPMLSEAVGLGTSLLGQKVVF